MLQISTTGRDGRPGTPPVMPSDKNGRIPGRINFIDLSVFIGICLAAGLSVIGHRIYTAEHRRLVEFETREENRLQRAQGFSRAKPVHISFILHSKLPAYLRRSVAPGDAENRETYQEFPMRLLAMEPISAGRDAHLLFLGGKAAETSSGLILTGLKRPVRLGERFRFSTKKYRLSGVIVRIFRSPIDPRDFPDIARRMLNQL